MTRPAAAARPRLPATHFAGAPSEDNTFYEVKYRDPVNGLIFDITAHGWVGAKKENASQAPQLSQPELQADRSDLEKTLL